MENNPYSSIINTFREDRNERAVSPWRLGIAVSRSPLVIRLGKENLSGPDLMVNPALTQSGREDELLSPGDQVALLQSGDGQQYIVLCKVVSG